MRFDSAFDFYTAFDEHSDAFKQAASFAEFCKLAGLDYLSRYVWASDVFETAKAGKRTYHALKFPNANKFSDLFEAAVFVPTPQRGERSHTPDGYMFLSGNASHCGHVGGNRSWSERTEGTRAHYGAKFYGTYVKPRTEVHNVSLTLTEHSAGYEAIRRDDGILIIGNDGLCIGSVWLALLPLTEHIESMFDAETLALIEREKQAEVEAWGESA
jgi:hypothetical protein